MVQLTCALEVLSGLEGLAKAQPFPGVERESCEACSSNFGTIFNPFLSRRQTLQWCGHFGAPASSEQRPSPCSDSPNGRHHERTSGKLKQCRLFGPMSLKGSI